MCRWSAERCLSKPKGQAHQLPEISSLFVRYYGRLTSLPSPLMKVSCL